jgi:hypothetical protein
MVYEWIQSEWKWILSILLPALALYYSYRVYRKQVISSKIAEIREMLRDVGDVNLSSNLKVRPTLRRFVSPILRKKYVEIEFKFYIGAGGHVLLNGLPPSGWMPTRPNWGFPEKIDLSKIDYAESKSVQESGIIIKISTTDPIKCKEVVEKIIHMMLKNEQ